MKILAVGDSFMPSSYFEAAFAPLEAEGHAVSYRELDAASVFTPRTASEVKLREYQGAPGDLLPWLSGIDVLAVHGAPVTDQVVDAAESLRLVCCARGGPVNVDVDALTARRVPLVITPGKNAEAVADLTMAFLVMLARGLPNAQRFLADGGKLQSNWDGVQFFGNDLRRHTLGLVGFGAIGRRVAARAIPFGLKIIVYDPFQVLEDELVERVDSLAALLARADFVSLHARASSDNEKLIDAAAIAAMKRGAFLINTARETLVDEDALDAGLATGALGGAALDVVFPTDAPGPHRLLRHENVVMTPHIGGATRETLLQGAEMIAGEIGRFAAGEPLINVANRPKVTAT